SDSSACGGRATSPSCMAAATTTRRSRTPPRWRTGTARRRGAAAGAAGSAASPTPWGRAARPRSSSERSRRSRRKALTTRRRAADRAFVHGCGYDEPSFSPAAAMANWHSAARGGGCGRGWLGRLADAMGPGGAPALAVGAKPALAVKGLDHAPAEGAFALAREACAEYRTPIDYGPAPLGLSEIAALIAADAPVRLYYTSHPGNAFDTHVHQNELHRRLLACTADAIAAFMADMARIGRADRVVVLLFSEFGRKVAENASLGTDHGTAGPMFVIGRPVRGGHYGAAPSLTDLTEDGNLRHTVDFRRVYATAAAGWLGHPDTRGLLGEDFEPFAMFG